MRYIFLGTPRFAEIILADLVKAGMEPAAVISNPDRPAGRKKIITSPPVKVLASEKNIPVLQPEIFDAAFLRKIKEFGADFGIVAAYGKIVPDTVLKIFPKGVIGVHPSLLPKYRGASPIQSVLLAEEKETGVTLYMLDEKMDHGPIIAATKMPVPKGIDYPDLLDVLARKSGELLTEVLPEFNGDKLKPEPQDESLATYTKKFTAEDAKVDLERDDPEEILRKIKALNPEPGVWAMRDGKRIKILDAELASGHLELKKIQFEGKNPQSL